MTIKTTETTAKLSSTPDPWGGRTTVWAEEPKGWRDALLVLFGQYDARVVVQKYPTGSFDVRSALNETDPED